MLKVIINADDLGKSHRVNSAIEECIQKHLITSSTLMAGGEAFNEGVAIAMRHPEISFGVHLSIDEEMSITKSPVFLKYGIINENGVFVKGAIGKLDSIPADLKMAVTNEWLEQVNKVVNIGVNVSHLDSHHHYHTHPGLLDCITEVSHRCHVKRVRLRHLQTVDMITHHIKSKVPAHNSNSINDINNTNVANNRQKKITRAKIISDYFRDNWHQVVFKMQFKTADFFCSFRFFYENREYMLGHMKRKTVELMCHPGHPDYDEETSKLDYSCDQIMKINYWQL